MRRCLSGFCVAGILLLQAVCCQVFAGSEPADLKAILEPIQKECDLVSLAAAVVNHGKVVAIGAVGERKDRSGVKVTVEDKFHLGSCTKAMTATMIAILIEQGKLGWDTTIGEVLGDMEMREEYKKVTVRHLLSHRGGISHESWPTGKSFMDMHNLPGTPRQQRLTYAGMILNQEPEGKPGEKYVYSNAGFSILGVMAEEITDTAWEELMRRMLFGPLGMASAGFGAMGTEGQIDQPWQHKRGFLGRKKAIGPGRYSDNPAVIGPGGLVHCSMADWAKFVILHLEGGVYEGKRLIKKETLEELRKPYYGGNYAGGWLAVDRGWGGGRVFTHSGSNTQNYAVVWMAPLRGFAVLVGTNQGGFEEGKALDTVASVLIRQFGPGPGQSE